MDEAVHALDAWRARVDLSQTRGEKTGFAAFVERAGGSVPGSVREMWAAQGAASGHVWIELPATKTLGHGYLAINSLGPSAYSAREAQAIVAADVPAVFPKMWPFGSAGALFHGPEAQVGRTFTLPPVGFLVTVTAVRPHSFTLQTNYYHLLNGSATHGIFQDGTGELWMFNEGYGNPSGLGEGLKSALNDEGYSIGSIAEDLVTGRSLVLALLRSLRESEANEAEAKQPPRSAPDVILSDGTRRSQIEIVRQQLNSVFAQSMWQEMAVNAAARLLATSRVR